MKKMQQPSHKIFDFVAYIDWFQGIKCPEMAVFDRQNQYQGVTHCKCVTPFFQLIAFDLLCSIRSSRLSYSVKIPCRCARSKVASRS